MYSTLFTTTLVFALAALRVQADFKVTAVELTQVSDYPQGFSFFRFPPLILSHLDHSASLRTSPGPRPMVPTMSSSFPLATHAATLCGSLLCIWP